MAACEDAAALSAIEFTQRAKVVRDVEFARIAQRRPNAKRSDLWGLAISGGGIRSASFAIGVMQALQAQGVFKRFDYLSTVSGGGYAGSSLTWFLSKVRPGAFPFGKPGVGSRNVVRQDGEISENYILDFIRQRADYLLPGFGINLTSVAGVVFRSMIVSVVVYFALATFVTYLLYSGGAFDSMCEGAASSGSNGNLAEQCWGGFLDEWQWLKWVLGFLPDVKILRWLFATNPLIVLAAAMVALFVLLSAIYSLLTFVISRRESSAHQRRTGDGWARYLSRFPGKTYAWRILAQRIGGVLLVLAAAFAVLGSLPFALELIPYALKSIPGVEGDSGKAETAGAASVTAVLTAIVRYLRHLMERDQKAAGWLTNDYVAGAAAAVFVYSLLLLVYVTATLLKEPNYALGILAVGLVFGLVVNLNYVSMHRMYRDRLMEAFMPNRTKVRGSRWGPASAANIALLEEMCGADKKLTEHKDAPYDGPYHLINTNIILVGSRFTEFRGRGGDCFVLSPLWCGSDATGWCRTEEFMKGGSGLTLATAMAISGAAANPHAGPSGGGITRNQLVALLMALLNLRLGYWAPNPNPGRRPLWSTPDLFNPGLRYLFGAANREDKRYVELSDGGHFENLGLYELIRRRVKLIVVSDATADPDFTFSDLANAVERVRVDFGVDIRFKDETADLAGMIPGSEGHPAFLVEKYDLARTGSAFGTIDYPALPDGTPKAEGFLIYIKTTMTKRLPADVCGYKAENPTYPDQTTGDQFFDESQFEAYRELGYRLASKACQQAKVRWHWFAQPAG